MNSRKPGAWWRNCLSPICMCSLIRRAPVRPQPGSPTRYRRKWRARETEYCANSRPPKKHAFLRSLVGGEVEAITLQTGGVDFTEGLTDNYVKVKIGGRLTANRWMRVRVKQVEGDMLAGEPEFRGETSGQASAGLVTHGDTTGQMPVDLKPIAALR